MRSPGASRFAWNELAPGRAGDRRRPCLDPDERAREIDEDFNRRLLAMLDDFRVGDRVRLTLLRQGKAVEVAVTLQGD